VQSARSRTAGAGGPSKSIPDSGIHTIQSGDTFWSIENDYGLEHGSIQEYNPTISSNSLRPGMELNLEPDLPVGDEFIDVLVYCLAPPYQVKISEANMALPVITAYELVLAAAGAGTLAVAATSDGVSTDIADTSVPTVKQ
jgi:LysM repeat protein